MSYQVRILPRAQKELQDISSPNFERIRTALRKLAQEPRPPGCKKLSGRDGWRIRVGEYRIIYDVNPDLQIIEVVHIGHRREVYRG